MRSGSNADQVRDAEVKQLVEASAVSSPHEDSDVQAALIDDDRVVADWIQSFGMPDLSDFDIETLLDDECGSYSHGPAASFSTALTPDSAPTLARSPRGIAESATRCQRPVSSSFITAAKNPSIFPRSRNAKVKYELEQLRQRVQELERKLDRLQLSTTSTSPSPDTEVQTAEPSSQPTPWQLIAKKQVELTEKSEAANLELKQVLNTQKNFARSLSRVLRKHQDLSVRNSLRTVMFRPTLTDFLTGCHDFACTVVSAQVARDVKRCRALYRAARARARLASNTSERIVQ